MQVEMVVPVSLLLEVNEYMTCTAVGAKAGKPDFPAQPDKWTSRELELARRQLAMLQQRLEDAHSALAQRDDTIARLESKLAHYQELEAA